MGIFFIFCILISGSEHVKAQSIEEDFIYVKGQLENLTKLLTSLTTKMEYIKDENNDMREDIKSLAEENKFMREDIKSLVEENKFMREDIKSLVEENKVIIKLIKGGFDKLIQFKKENSTTITNQTKIEKDHPAPATTTAPPTTTTTLPPVGSSLLYTDTQYQYFKVEVPHGKMATNEVVVDTCRAASMYPVCPGPANCGDSSSKCVVTPMSGDCDDDIMEPISEILCQANDVSNCPELDKVFQYYGYYGSLGSIGGKFKGGEDVTSTRNSPLFAYCAKKI